MDRPNERTDRGDRTRLYLGGVAALMVLILVLPLWTTRMEAPQYQDEEILEVHVYPTRVIGDIREIELLNEYVGVHLPLDTPELTATPWVLGSLLVVALAAQVLPAGARRRTAKLLCFSMLLVLLIGGGLLQYRLYEMGHNRDDSIMTRVPDFTPPLLGSKKIANFTAHMSLGAGAWAYLAAILLAGWAAYGTGRSAGHRASPLAVEDGPDGGPALGGGASLRLRFDDGEGGYR